MFTASRFLCGTIHEPIIFIVDELGFKYEEMEAANDYVCGTMMLEGAPYLKKNICLCLTVPINVAKRSNAIFIIQDISV
jgi:hypothetical protein